MSLSPGTDHKEGPPKEDISTLLSPPKKVLLLTALMDLDFRSPPLLPPLFSLVRDCVCVGEEPPRRGLETDLGGNPLLPAFLLGDVMGASLLWIGEKWQKRAHNSSMQLQL